MAGYKDFLKYDARRHFVVLLAADDLGDRATLHYIAQEIGCTRAEAQRALDSAISQFGVQIEKVGSVYRILGWGVLKKSALRDIVNSV